MIRRDARSRYSTEARRAVVLPLHSPLAHFPMPMAGGAFATSRGSHTLRAVPRERAREQLRVSVWEDEGGSLPAEHAAPSAHGDPPDLPPIRR
jgi:hypothetical protein